MGSKIFTGWSVDHPEAQLLTQIWKESWRSDVCLLLTEKNFAVAELM